jgi:hypothetical protein
MKAASGWTWYSIVVEEVYGNSILTFYTSHDSYTGLPAAPDVPARSEKVTLIGKYTDPTPSPTVKIYFGCRRNFKGVCYRPLSGYFYQFKIWAGTGLKSVDLANEISTACTAGLGGCAVCALDGKCFTERSVIVFEVDFENDAQVINSKRPHTNFQFVLGSSTDGDKADPIRVPNQGLKFDKFKYVKRAGLTNYIQIPQIFTFEAFIRVDLENPGAYGDLQYIYEVYRKGQYFAIAMDNSNSQYLKVIVNDAEATYFHNWLSNSGWKYLAVTVIKT